MESNVLLLTDSFLSCPLFPFSVQLRFFQNETKRRIKWDPARCMKKKSHGKENMKGGDASRWMDVCGSSFFFFCIYLPSG
mmetsp:Transcript_25370/g.49568  ORF Transcript_25370/g.49568 Transcript_25370/m.49568 type:complete len:80 (+) Transcript_25370:719-958(+)